MEQIYNKKTSFQFGSSFELGGVVRARACGFHAGDLLA